MECYVGRVKMNCFLGLVGIAVSLTLSSPFVRAQQSKLDALPQARVPPPPAQYSATQVTAVRAGNRPNAYVVTNLVSDLPNTAAVQDPNLKNAWGVAFTPAASPFWIADNATGLATLYDGDGTIVPLVVTIPCPPTGKSPALSTQKFTSRRTCPISICGCGCWMSRRTAQL